MTEVIFALICIVGMLLVGFVATRFNRRLFQTPSTTPKSATVALVAILGGLAIGLVIVPSNLIPNNQYIRIALTVGIFVALSFIELSVIKQLSGKWLNGYILDKDIFPFASLGFACALLLKQFTL